MIVILALAIATFKSPALSPEWGMTEGVRTVGKALLGCGVLILVLAYGAMARARTTINPRRPTRRIVTRGIYRFTRNPIYIGWFLVVLGGGLANASPLRALVAVPMILLLH